MTKGELISLLTQKFCYLTDDAEVMCVDSEMWPVHISEVKLEIEDGEARLIIYDKG